MPSPRGRNKIKMLASRLELPLPRLQIECITNYAKPTYYFYFIIFGLDSSRILKTILTALYILLINTLLYIKGW